MEVILQIAVLGFLVEALVDTLKLLYADGKIIKSKLVSIVIGLVVALAVGADIFDAIGITTQFPIVGVVSTGILISRGGNFIHDLVDRIKE